MDAMLSATTRSSSFPVFLMTPEPDDWQSDEKTRLCEIIETRQLQAVFQPILDLNANAYIAFEGLIRGPVDTSLHSPQALFDAADRHGLRRDLERACRETIFRAFAALRLPGKLFINSSPDCLDDEHFLNGNTLDLLHQLSISTNRIVIELTENQRISDYPNVHRTIAHYRSLGYKIAIDDLGEGFANLRMWSEIQPDFVKIDRHFIDRISEDSLKHHFVKAMQNLAESCAAQIVAEGIETEADCLAVRDLGIAFGQGYLIAMPTAEPRTIPSETVIAVIKRRNIAVFPSNAIPAGTITVRSLTRHITPASPESTNEAVYNRFDTEPDLMSMPVVANSTPLGLIERHELVDRMGRPYRREIYGRKSCIQFMDPMPLCIDEDATIQEAALIVSRSINHRIHAGFVVTRNGEYLGIASAHDLMGRITEMQIQAARYANPLTQLPGNVPINEHIDRLIEKRGNFVACYFDLDHFKPFNDVFGYRKGDDLIILLAQTLSEILDPLTDFCGHIGGDDFMVLFQSPDWEERCEKALRLFDELVVKTVDASLLEDTGYYAENRRGKMVFYKLPSLSIGAVPVSADAFESHREVSAAAAEAKKNAKRSAGSSLFVERRQRPTPAPHPDTA